MALQRLHRVSLLILVLLAATQAFAESSSRDTIVVTATRTETPLDDAIVPVTVISRADIELSLATDLSELLRFEAGIDIGRNGGPGQATSIFMRGTESNHTLVLIDGVRMNPGTLGGAAVQHIAPEMIERVEIVKGARSALFGTDAIGGVINIITRRSDDAYVEGSLGAGSFDTQSAFLSAGNQSEKSEFGATVNWTDTEGYAPRNDSDIERGYDNLSLNAYGMRHFGRSRVSLRHWRTSGQVEYLDFVLAPVDQDFENSTTAIEIDSTLSDNASSKLVVSHMRDDLSQNQVDDFVESSRMSLDWQLSKAFDAHTLSAGLFYMDEAASTLSFGAGFDETTVVKAVFLQDQWSHGRHRAFAAVRLSDHEAFGNHSTWNAEYAYELTDSWTLNAGLGHAFRAPDATDRFGFGGNASLNPETADEAQFSLRYAPGNRHSVDIEAYRNDIDDLIEFNFSSFALENIARAEIRGVQLGYAYQGDSFALRASFVRQSADNAETGQRLLRRAEEIASLSYTQDFAAHRIGVSIVASGDREDFGGVPLDGYVLANLSGQFELGGRLSLNARIENLLDTEYETAANFRMQERSGFVELRYRWN